MLNWIKATFYTAVLYVVGSPLLYAADGADAAMGMGMGMGRGQIAMAAALAISVAATGGAIGQGKAIASAVDGIARNPEAGNKVFTPMIVGLVLIESLVIYALVIAFLLYGKV